MSTVWIWRAAIAIRSAIGVRIAFQRTLVRCSIPIVVPARLCAMIDMT